LRIPETGKPSRAWLLALFFDQPPILVMRTDPDPDEVPTVFCGESAVSKPGSYRPQLSDSLEMERGMGGVLLQDFKIRTGHCLDRFWQSG
jgi:hypothetical protein